ncbi:hypothetical protein Tco_0008308 [Tanacetum coccineum]
MLLILSVTFAQALPRSRFPCIRRYVTPGTLEIVKRKFYRKMPLRQTKFVPRRRRKAVPTVAPQGSQILLADAATQTKYRLGLFTLDLGVLQPQPNPKQDVVQSSKEAGGAGNQDSENSTPSPSITGSPGSIYQPGWGVPNDCRLDTPEACQDVVDHIAPPGYFSELRHMPNDEFLSQYNINLAKQVAMGSQLRLRFEQEAKLLKKSVAQVARRDQRIATREKHIKDLEAQLEAEINMKKAAEVKNSE